MEFSPWDTTSQIHEKFNTEASALLDELIMVHSKVLMAKRSIENKPEFAEETKKLLACNMDDLNTVNKKISSFINGELSKLPIFNS